MAPTPPRPAPVGDAEAAQHQWQCLDFRRWLYWCSGCGCLKEDRAHPRYCPPGGNWSQQEPPCADRTAPAPLRSALGAAQGEG